MGKGVKPEMGDRDRERDRDTERHRETETETERQQAGGVWRSSEVGVGWGWGTGAEQVFARVRLRVWTAPAGEGGEVGRGLRERRQRTVRAVQRFLGGSFQGKGLNTRAVAGRRRWLCWLVDEVAWPALCCLWQKGKLAKEGR